MKKMKVRNICVRELVNGVLVGLGVIVIFAAIISLCVAKGYIEINNYKYAAAVAWIVAAVLSSFVSRSRGDGATIYISMLSGGAVNILLLLVGVLMFDRLDSSMILLGVTTGVLGGCVGGVLRYRQKSSNHKRRHRARSR